MKNERVFHEDYETRAKAKQNLFEYIDVFYNRKRRHSAAWIAEKKLAA